jgi:subfamily B ATP-binding cassette protein MsbA
MIRALVSLLHLARPHWRRLVGMYVCMWVYAASNALFTLCSGPILAQVFTANVSSLSSGSAWGGVEMIPAWLAGAWGQSLFAGNLWWLPVLVLLVALVKAVAQVGQNYLLGSIAARTAADIRGQFSRRLLSQSLIFLQQQRQGDLLTKMTHDIQIIEAGIFQGLGAVLRDTLVVGGLLLVCLYCRADLFWISCLTLPVVIGPMARFARSIKKIAKRNQKKQGHFAAHLAETLNGFLTVKAYHQAGTEAVHLQQLNRMHCLGTERSYFLRALRSPASELLATMVLCGLMMFIVLQARAHHGQSAAYVSFFVAMFSLYEPLKKLGATSDYIGNALAALERLRDIPEGAECTELAAGSAALAWPEGSRPICGVVYRGVSCQMGQQWVLRDIHLSIAPGETVIVVGMSGAGKSTLARLLPRFYPLAEGDIFIDGKSTQLWSLSDLRRYVAYVDQDAFLFHRTIAENIAYGLPYCSRAKIEEAAALARVDEFAARLPEGLDSLVGERGQNLSGGQRQRISLARAFLYDAPILILDEATSQLDAENEQYVQQALARLLENRTAMVITHRFNRSLYPTARVVFLEQGRLRAFGSHESLLQTCAGYERLFSPQVYSACAAL